MLGNLEKNIFHLGLSEGMKVADFGAGSGFYLQVLSERVGNSGHVYAIEVQKELVKKLEQDIKDKNLSNVSVIWGDIEKKEGTKITSNSVDAVLLSNILFQTEDTIGLIEEVKRVLKNNGKVLLIEPEREETHFIRKEKAEDLFTKINFKKLEDLTISDGFYGIIFQYEE